jgi:hypothetical protein
LAGNLLQCVSVTIIVALRHRDERAGGHFLLDEWRLGALFLSSSHSLSASRLSHDWVIGWRTGKAKQKFGKQKTETQNKSEMWKVES